MVPRDGAMPGRLEPLGMPPAEHAPKPLRLSRLQTLAKLYAHY